jgi:hypothetical protein
MVRLVLSAVILQLSAATEILKPGTVLKNPKKGDSYVPRSWEFQFPPVTDRNMIVLPPVCDPLGVLFCHADPPILQGQTVRRIWMETISAELRIPDRHTTLRSIGNIARHQRLKDNNQELVPPNDMLAELRNDNQELTCSLRAR